MNVGGHVFEIIERIAAARPFALDRVAAIVGIDVIEIERNETAGFRYGKTNASSDVFAAVEIRERLAPRTGRDGLVILNLVDQPCIDQTEVMLRYGSEPILSVPTPHQPGDAPLHLDYRYGWGHISFGFARTGEKCLTRIVFDATGA